MSILKKIHNTLYNIKQSQVLLLLCAIGLLCYFNTLTFPFVHDDVVFIVQNPNIDRIDLKQIFDRTSPLTQDHSIVNDYYRPFLEILYRLQYKVFRFHAGGYHFLNIILHVLNSFLVFLIAMCLVKDREEKDVRQDQEGLGFSGKMFALAVSVFFLTHPVQSEAVACISGISNLIFVFLLLGSFYFYIQFEEKRRVGLYVASLFAFLLSLLAKEQAIVLPFLIVLYDLWISKYSKSYLKKVFQCLPFFVLLLGYFLAREHILGLSMASVFDFKGELWLRILAIPQTLLMYIKIMFYPVDLHYYRNTDILLPWVLPTVFLSLLIGILLFLVLKLKSFHRRYVAFGLGFFFITLAPVLNIVPLVNEYSFILTAEHFLYLPLLGVIISVLVAFDFLAKKFNCNRHILFQISLFLVLVFIGITHKQVTYWRGEIPLFERTIAFEKDFGRGHLLLAKAYFRAGRLIEAQKEYERALEIMTRYVEISYHQGAKEVYLGFIKEIHRELAQCLFAKTDYQGSIDHYLSLLKMQEGDMNLYNGIAMSYCGIYDSKNAEFYFEKTLQFDQGNLMIRNNMGVCFMKSGAFQKAFNVFDSILKMDSDYAPTLENLELLKETLKLREHKIKGLE